MADQDQASLLERYRRLAEISRNLASTVDLNILLDRITHAAAYLCGSEAASILLFDEGKKQLYFESRFPEFYGKNEEEDKPGNAFVKKNVEQAAESAYPFLRYPNWRQAVAGL